MRSTLRFPLVLAALATSLWCGPAFAQQGACLWQQPYPKVRCRETSATSCASIAGSKFFPGKTCEDLRKENASLASITVPGLPGLIADAFARGFAVGEARFTATDLFAEATDLAGTSVEVRGYAAFELRRVGGGVLQVRSRGARIEPRALVDEALPAILRARAEELFASLAFTAVRFTGRLERTDEGFSLELQQYKEFGLGPDIGVLGSVESTASAFVPEGAERFELRGEGLTTHPLLAVDAAPLAESRTVGGFTWYKVDFPAGQTARSVCASVGAEPTAFSYTAAVCQAFHPDAAASQSQSGSAAVAFCTGAENGECALRAQSCHRCPTCAVGVGFDEDASDLYGEMYVRCVELE